VYNLGFIALARYEKVKDFVKWWDDRVLKYGYCDFSRNMFYDQMWINYLPSLFDNYLILKHLGYNMANWNLHERKLTNISDQNYRINNQIPLRFFHFSGYKFNNPNKIASYLTRYNFETRTDLKDLFSFYNKNLLSNNIETISELQVYYRAIHENINISKGKKNVIKRVIDRLQVTLKILLTGRK
jgi:hypothetical protein